MFPPQISETIRGVRRDMMQITEPVTMLTDYLLAAASLVFALFTARRIGPRTRVCAWFWCAAFVASGVAAVLGGTYHGFSIYLDPRTRGKLWDVTLYLTGAAAAFITAGIHAAYIKRKDGTVKWLVWGIAMTLLGVLVQQSRIPRHQNFNHNDAYHLIQILAMYFLYRCGRTLRDRPGIEHSVAAVYDRRPRS